jgi:tetratricopeptide (TPR) repeat protein
MSQFDPTIDAIFREYVELQLRRHNLLTEGKEKDPEFDQTEDKMTELWEKLDATQRLSVNGMASDLNWIRRKGQPPAKGRTVGEVNPAERHELLSARALEEWHKFLHYLRLCASIIPAASLAYLRGTTYDAVGLPAYATDFFELAADLEPANASMGVIALRAVDRADPAKAQRRAEQILASSVQFPPTVVAMSAVLVLRRDEAAGRPIDRQRFSTALNDAIKRLQLEPPSEASRTMAYQLAASGFEIINDLPAALHCYNEGLKFSPKNDVLLVGKGLLLYGRQTDQAIEALGAAAETGTTLVWPYFFLAHHHVLNRNYDASLQMGKKAWERATTNSVRAELLQWRAICLTELHFPVEKVRPIFERAVSLDPSNPQIAKNLAAFDEAVAEAEEPEWDIEAEETLRVERAASMTEMELLGIP